MNPECRICGEMEQFIGFYHDSRAFDHMDRADAHASWGTTPAIDAKEKGNWDCCRFKTTAGDLASNAIRPGCMRAMYVMSYFASTL